MNSGSSQMAGANKLTFGRDPAMTVIAWLEQLHLLGGQQKFITAHMTAIRTGALPHYFAEHLHTLNPRTVLALAASKPSIWSEPFYQLNSPDCTITVDDILTHRQGVKDKADMELATQSKTTAAPNAAAAGTKKTSKGAMRDSNSVDEVEGGKRQMAIDREDEPKRPTTTETWRERERTRCADYNAHAEKAVAFLRNTLSITACNTLDTSQEYIEAVANEDVLQTYHIIMRRALFTSVNPQMFVRDLKAKIDSASSIYVYSPAKQAFSDLATLYLRTYQLLVYADPTIKESYMVNALVNNLPSTAEFAVARHALRTPKFTSDDVELAKVDLGKAIAFITDEMFTHNSLNPVANLVEMNNVTRPRDKSGGGAASSAEPSELHAAIMSLTTVVGRMQQPGGGRNDARTDERNAPIGSIACRNFSRSKCEYGDLCRYMHSTLTKPDARMHAGKMLPQFQQAIEEFSKKSYADKMAALHVTRRKETVLTLKASLADAQKELASLRASGGGQLY